MFNTTFQLMISTKNQILPRLNNQYLGFLSNCASIEYLPGPAIIKATKQIRYKSGNSCLPKGSEPWTIKVITVIFMINGIKTTRLIKPTTNNAVQKISAKTTSCRDSAGPNPSGSPKELSRSLKLIILGRP